MMFERAPRNEFPNGLAEHIGKVQMLALSQFHEDLLHFRFNPRFDFDRHSLHRGNIVAQGS